MQHPDLPQDDYQLLLTTFIQKQMSVLGPEVALKIVGKVPTLLIDKNGKVIDIAGNPGVSVTKLIAEFSSLSKNTTEKSLQPLLKKYGHLIGKTS